MKWTQHIIVATTHNVTLNSLMLSLRKRCWANHRLIGTRLKRTLLDFFSDIEHWTEKNCDTFPSTGLYTHERLQTNELNITQSDDYGCCTSTECDAILRTNLPAVFWGILCFTCFVKFLQRCFCSSVLWFKHELKKSSWETNFTLNICNHLFISYAKLSEKLTFLTTWYTYVRVRAYQGVRNVSFAENFAHVLHEWSKFVQALFISKICSLSWRRSLLYRNQSSDLLCKSMDCFLYDWELLHERAKVRLIHFSQMDHFFKKPVTSFGMQIK